MLKGFISYAHEDGELACRDLRRQLAKLEANGVARFWTDKQLRAGDKWEDQIQRELDAADIAIFLITPRALDPNSYVRHTELPLAKFKAEHQGLVIVPVLAIRTHWEIEPLAQRQACPVPPWYDLNGGEQARIDWAFRAAEAIEQSVNQIPAPQTLAEVQALLLGIEECDRLIADGSIEVSRAIKIGLIKFLALLRQIAKAPLADLYPDLKVAASITSRFYSSSGGLESLQAAIDRIQSAIEKVILATSGQDYEYDAGVVLSKPTGDRMKELLEVASDMEKEIHFLLQKRRMDADSQEVDARIETMARIAERKLSLIDRLLEESQVDFSSLVTMTNSLALSAKGFYSSIKALKVSRDLVRDVALKFVGATQKLDFKSISIADAEREAANAKGVVNSILTLIIDPSGQVWDVDNLVHQQADLTVEITPQSLIDNLVISKGYVGVRRTQTAHQILLAPKLVRAESVVALKSIMANDEVNIVILGSYVDRWSFELCASVEDFYALLNKFLIE